MQHKCLICFLILLASLLVGWIGGWSRAMKTGNEAYQHGNYSAAQVAFQEATFQKPDNPVAHYNLGTVRYKMGRFDEAATGVSGSVSKAQGRHRRDAQSGAYLLQLGKRAI